MIGSIRPSCHQIGLTRITTSQGGAVGFYAGDTTKLMDDLVNLKPTVFASVPRLYNKIYDGVLSAVNKKGGIAKQLFDYAYKSKLSYLQKGQGSTHALWDRVVFGKIKEKLGGRVKIMLTGSAPLSGDVLNFFRIVFCTTFIEGYGQTENFCGISMGDCADVAVGHVGAIDPCCEVKLVDVPDLNYRSTDKPYPRGEICVRGPMVFQGYYKDPEKTAETIDKDGWQHTGDIGQFGDAGRLQIIDRVKVSWGGRMLRAREAVFSYPAFTPNPKLFQNPPEHLQIGPGRVRCSRKN